MFSLCISEVLYLLGWSILVTIQLSVENGIFRVYGYMIHEFTIGGSSFQLILMMHLLTCDRLGNVINPLKYQITVTKLTSDGICNLAQRHAFSDICTPGEMCIQGMC